MPTVHTTACPLDCPDACSLEVGRGRTGRQARRQPPQPAHRGLHLRQGAPLPRAPLRRRTGCSIPLRRVGREGGGRFERITWDEALGRRGAARARRASAGAASRSCRTATAARTACSRTSATDARLFRRLGASRLLRTVCAAATGRAATGLYGKMPGVALDDYAHARLIVVWGANPSATGIHLVPIVQEAQRRGAKLVVIDPRRTPLATQADLHLAVRPGARPAARARGHPLAVRERPRRPSLPRRARDRRRGAAAPRRALDARARRRRRRRAGGGDRGLRPALRRRLAGGDALRLGPRAQPQRRLGGGRGARAAGGGRQVRRARRRLHAEQRRRVELRPRGRDRRARAADARGQHEPARRGAARVRRAAGQGALRLQRQPARDDARPEARARAGSRATTSSRSSTSR